MWKALTANTPAAAKNNTLLEQIARDIEQFKYPGNGLFSGTLGQALFYIYYGIYLSDESYVDKGLEVLESVIQATSEEEFPQLTFANGLSGLANTLLLLHEADLLELAEEDLEQFDLVLTSAVQLFNRDNNFDFLHGLTGCAVYFANRLRIFGPNETAENVLKETIGHLQRITEQAETGAYPVTKVTFGELSFQGINFGLSHGMPSFIYLLLQIHRAGLEQELCKNMIYAYIGFMFSKSNPMPGSLSYFPSAITQRAEDYDGDLSVSRLAWCYGDLGIGMVLIQAALYFNDKGLFQKAEEILLFQAGREAPSMNESGLCHGTSGLMHIFNRLYQTTGNKAFKTAAEYWLEETYKQAKYPGNQSGLQTPNWQTKVFEEDGSLLTGIAGTGLTLMALNTDQEPLWDKLLLLC